MTTHDMVDKDPVYDSPTGVSAVFNAEHNKVQFFLWMHTLLIGIVVLTGESTRKHTCSVCAMLNQSATYRQDDNVISQFRFRQLGAMALVHALVENQRFTLRPS